MPRKLKHQPTDLELKILQVLWDESPLPVRQIRAKLEAMGKPLAHTTVITMLNIMAEKKLVKRAKQKNALWFAPLVPRERVCSAMTDTLVERLFGGSRIAVMQHLLDATELDAEELAEIRKLLNRKARKQS